VLVSAGPLFHFAASDPGVDWSQYGILAPVLTTVVAGVGWMIRREANRADKAEQGKADAFQLLMDKALPAIEAAQSAVKTAQESHSEMTAFLQRLRDESVAEKRQLTDVLSKATDMQAKMEFALERAERTIADLRR
jgi:hypothetical protein